MFFSVIISTYNPRKYLPRIFQAFMTNDCRGEIEIILADDKSGEDFQDIIDAYPELHVVVVSNKHHAGFPRDGKQNGANNAGGKWLCFMDQDDGWVDHAFDRIKAYILDHDIHNYLACDFISHVEGTDRYEIYSGTMGWTHGKFYETEFWDKYRLGYDEVKYCEDINLTTRTGCVLIAEDIPMERFEEATYIWNRTPESLSNSDGYFAKSMPDYVRGTIGVIVRHMEEHREDSRKTEQYAYKFMQTLYHVYFYCQNERIWPEKGILFQTAVTMRPFYERFLEMTGLTTEGIIQDTYTAGRGLYEEMRRIDFGHTPFVEEMTFRDWMRTYLG